MMDEKLIYTKYFGVDDDPIDIQINDWILDHGVRILDVKFTAGEGVVAALVLYESFVPVTLG